MMARKSKKMGPSGSNHASNRGRSSCFAHNEVGRAEDDQNTGRRKEKQQTEFPDNETEVPEPDIVLEREVLEKCRDFKKCCTKNGGKKKIPDWVYDENNSCFGGVVKSKGLVLETLSTCHPPKKGLNINSLVVTFGNVVGELDDTKKKWVADMGLERLLGFGGRGLPRRLCYWLLTRVNPKMKCLVTRDGTCFPLSKVQVHWVLGLPVGGKVVPLSRKKRSAEMKKDIDVFWKQYSEVSEGGTRGISRRKLIEVVLSTGDEDEFKKVFLMLALNTVLCPTTCHRISVRLLPAVTLAKTAAQYDWCTVVLDHLMLCVESFAKGFYSNGFAKGAGGCVYFLAVLYLDRIKRAPLQWGHFPRLDVWPVEVVREVACEDMDEAGDYGILGSVDAAYGRPHPAGARDLMPGEVLQEQLGRVILNFQNVSAHSSCASGESVTPEIAPLKRKSGVSPYKYKMRKKAREQEVVQNKEDGHTRDGAANATNPCLGDNFSSQLSMFKFL